MHGKTNTTKHPETYEHRLRGLGPYKTRMCSRSKVVKREKGEWIAIWEVIFRLSSTRISLIWRDLTVKSSFSVSFVQTVVNLYLWWNSMILYAWEQFQGRQIGVGDASGVFWPTKIRIGEWKMKNRFWFYESHKCARVPVSVIKTHQSNQHCSGKSVFGCHKMPD